MRLLDREKALTFAAVLAAAVASVATSAIDWKLGNETSGDVSVAGDGSARVVHVQVRSSTGAQLRIEAEPDVASGQPLAPPVTLVVTPAVVYVATQEADAAAPTNANESALPAISLTTRTTVGRDLGGAPCERNCVADVELRFERAAPGQPPVRVHWVVKAGISGYGDGSGDVPPDAYVDVLEQK